MNRGIAGYLHQYNFEAICRPLTEDCSREIDGVFELRSGSQTKGRITVALKWVQVLSHVVVPQTENGTVPRGGVTAAPDQPLDSSELENAAVLEFGLSSLTIKVACSDSLDLNAVLGTMYLSICAHAGGRPSIWRQGIRRFSVLKLA